MQLKLTFLYGTLLLAHFFYAKWLIRSGICDLKFGSIHKPWQILTLLLLINSFSLSVWLWDNTNWNWFNFGFHLLLAVDEGVRLAREGSFRWPFLLNHLGFAALILLQRTTLR